MELVYQVLKLRQQLCNELAQIKICLIILLVVLCKLGLDLERGVVFNSAGARVVL